MAIPSNLTKLIKSTYIILFIMFCLGLLVVSLPQSGWKALSVQTGSMEPAVPTGSLVMVNSVPADSLRPGDIITFKSGSDPNKSITHRFIGTEQTDSGATKYITKGDAGNARDPGVYSRQIIGKVMVVAPFLGKIANFARTLPGMLLIVYLPALLIIISEIRLMIKRLMEVEEREQRLAQLNAVSWENMDLLPDNDDWYSRAPLNAAGARLGR